ncbi:MAG: glutamyl/glutaminyl-tRNA synthetase [Phycisphaerales bacterium]|jgi:glutamyl/glutaminyl-tRNA synthetase
MTDPAPASHAVITRFAPSPTGRLHVGGARTALFCWAFAQRAKAQNPAAGGSGFLLRIEDTDQQRSSEAATANILAAMAWLGLGWDEGPEHAAQVNGAGVTLGGDPRSVGPFYQSQRLDLYNQQIEKLIDQGKAYPAFETPEELDAARARSKAAKVQYRYDRASMKLSPADAAARVASGEAHVVRFKMPDEAITVHDKALGDVTVGADELDDFIIRKKDGFPTYHMAVVVDDLLMGVTHVLRGQEHLINTPRHIALQRALGAQSPVYAHLPLIFNPDGSKMGKRDKDKALKKAVRDAGLDTSPIDAIPADEFTAWLGDKSKQLPTDQLLALAAHLGTDLPEIDVDDFFASGYLPEALNNYLALLGWNPKTKNEDGSDLEHFDMDYLASNFGFEGLSKAPSKFDRVKLLAFNADRIQNRMSDADFASTWRAWAEVNDPTLCARLSEADMQTLAPAVKQRCKTLRDGRTSVAFALIQTEQIEYDAKAVKKNLHKNEFAGLAVLGELKAVFESIEDWSPAVIHGAIEAFAASKDIGMGQVAQPLRVAIAGVAVTPPLGETLAVVGREQTLARIDRCVAQCQPAEA